MATPWRDIPLPTKLFLNVPEEDLTRAHAAIENAFINEANGQSRFPGLTEVCDLPNDNGRVYLHEWRGSLVAGTSNGNLFRVDRNHTPENVTDVPISGDKRIVFARTTNELVMAAGGPLIRYDGARKTEVLAEEAPDSSFVAFIDNYLVAIEEKTGRFRHCEPGDFRNWPALDVFTADAVPDIVHGIIATPFRELLICGPESTEQFERLANANAPFFRRWGVAEGVLAPGTITFADDAAWWLNQHREFVRVSGQSSEPRSDDLGLVLEGVGDDELVDAWAGGYPFKPLHIAGQKFILLQFPNALNPYETKGLTFIYDYRKKKWTTLYGWDAELGLPARWPGWSHWSIYGNVYVGGEGKIYRLDKTSFTNGGTLQRMLGRTAHFSDLGEIRIDNLRLRLKRGAGTNATEGTISLRAKRDNKNWTSWKRKGLGRAGQNEMFVEFGNFGCGHTWQFEWFVTDNIPVEVQLLQVQATPLGS